MIIPIVFTVIDIVSLCFIYIFWLLRKYTKWILNEVWWLWFQIMSTYSRITYSLSRSHREFVGWHYFDKGGIDFGNLFLWVVKIGSRIHHSWFLRISFQIDPLHPPYSSENISYDTKYNIFLYCDSLIPCISPIYMYLRNLSHMAARN